MFVMSASPGLVIWASFWPHCVQVLGNYLSPWYVGLLGIKVCCLCIVVLLSLCQWWIKAIFISIKTLSQYVNGECLVYKGLCTGVSERHVQQLKWHPLDPHSMCLGAVCSSYKHLTKRRYSLGQQVVFMLYYKCCHNFHKLLIAMSLVYLQYRCCLPYYLTTHHLRH